jgi:GNAT superfamily N-acetyltransferase
MTTFADRARASVRRLTRDDGDDWVAFQARAHGRDAWQASPVWLRWLADNPEHDGDELPVWICRRNGAIVGSQGGLPFRVKEGQRVLSASWAVNLMVEPEWRLRGVGPVLSEALTRANELVAALGISNAAYRAYLRSGWRDLGDFSNYMRPCDVEWSVRQARLQGGRAFAARALARPALALTRLGSRLVARAMRTEICPVRRFDERVDQVWVAAAARYAVMAVRDYRTLAWRFDAVPDADRSERYYLMQRGRVRGYVVTRVERLRDRQILVILDYLASPRWVLPLLAHVSALAEARNAAAIICQTLSPGNDIAFHAAGFLRVGADNRPRALIPAAGTPFRFMVYQGDRQERLAFDRRQWFLTRGDSDIGWGQSGPIV